MNNGKSPRNADGRPVVCEEMAQVLGMLARSELNDLTENFKHLYKDL